MAIDQLRRAAQVIGVEPGSEIARVLDRADSSPVLVQMDGVRYRCAMVREDLKRSSRRVGHRFLDLITAATALENDLILVTRNTAGYDDIPGLQLHA